MVRRIRPHSLRAAARVFCRDAADQVEQPEVHQGRTVGVGGVLADRQVCLVPEQLIEGAMAFAGGRHDLLRRAETSLHGQAGYRAADEESLDFAGAFEDGVARRSTPSSRRSEQQRGQ